MVAWWVNQGKTYKAAHEHGLLWAPLADRVYWRALEWMQPGDLVIHYAKGRVRSVGKVRASWEPAPILDGYDGALDEIGRSVKVEYVELDREPVLAEIPLELRLSARTDGPFRVDGAVKLGYAFPVSSDVADLVMHAAYPAVAGSEVLTDASADAVFAMAQVRPEQKKLRDVVVGPGPTATCAVCGQTFPIRYVHAGHIKKRSECSESERQDFAHVAMPVCVTGCDALFEYGDIHVDESGTIRTRDDLEGDLAVRAASVAGRTVAGFNPKSAVYFAHHRDRALARTSTADTLRLLGV